MISTNASLIKDVHWRGNRCPLIVSKRDNMVLVTAVRTTSHLSVRLTAMRMTVVKTYLQTGLKDVLPHCSTPSCIKGYFSLNDFYAWAASTSKIQRNNYHHESCGPFLTVKRRRCL